MSQGTNKKLVSDKGFGFIEGEPFELLREGQAVDYTEGHGPKGPQAESVKVV